MRVEVGGFWNTLLGVMMLFVAGTGVLSYVLIGESAYLSPPFIALYGVMGTVLVSARYSARVRRRQRSVRDNGYVQATISVVVFSVAILLFVFGGSTFAVIVGGVLVVVALEIVYNYVKYS